MSVFEKLKNGSAGIAEAGTDETERVTEEENRMFASMPENMRTVLF